MDERVPASDNSFSDIDIGFDLPLENTSNETDFQGQATEDDNSYIITNLDSVQMNAIENVDERSDNYSGSTEIDTTYQNSVQDAGDDFNDTLESHNSSDDANSTSDDENVELPSVRVPRQARRARRNVTRDTINNPTHNNENNNNEDVNSDSGSDAGNSGSSAESEGDENTWSQAMVNYDRDVELESDYHIGWEWINGVDAGSTLANFTGERLYLGDVRNIHPEDFFMEIFEEDLWEKLVTETNRYANDRKQRRYNPGKNKSFIY